jgi:multidrug resistance efflux pump
MENPLATTTPTQLSTIASDQFLPPPGMWAQRIGSQVLVAIGVLLAAAAVLPFEQTVRSQGVVRPTGENSLVQSRLAGKVQRVLMRPNQQVQPGQVLAVLDRSSLLIRQRQAQQEWAQVQEQIRQAQLQRNQLQAEMSSSGLMAKASLASSRGDVAKAKASLAFATDQMRRYRDLARQGAVPQLLSQEKITGHLLAISEMQQAELSVAQQRARQLGERAKLQQALSGVQSNLAGLERQASVLKTDLAEASRAVTDATVRAPIAASIISTNLKHPGQIVSAGQVLAELAPSHAPMLIKSVVKAQEVSRIKPGQTVYLRISGCPHTEFGLLRGDVMDISADALASKNAQVKGQTLYELSIRPRQAELRQGTRRCRLRFGMDLQADVMTERTTMLGFLLRKLRLIAQV